MSNKTDLDWLARVLHKWPDGDGITMLGRGCSFFDTGFGRAVHVYAVDGSDYTTIKEKDWLARRAELQNKPSWDDFGESAKFMAQDSDGAWMAFESEPAANYHVWSSMRGWCGYAREGRDRCRGEVLGDWRDTLEKRPEQTIADICREVTGENRREEIFEPFVSVEDAKITIMQSDGDVKDFGGIIGRSLPLKEYATTAKQPSITPSKYTKTIHGVSVDVYDVLQAWGVINPALQHLIKKALQCGQRGHKDNAQDLQDIIDSAIRAKELD